MSKFCSQCGHVLADDAIFCENCGNAINTASEVPQPKKGFLQKLRSFTWKIWLLIVAAVAALGVGIYFLTDALFINTYETSLDSYVEYLNIKSFSYDACIKALNGFAEQEFEDVFNIYEKCHGTQQIQNLVQRQVELLEKNHGSNYIQSCKIEDKKKLDKDALKDFEDELIDLGTSFKKRTSDYDSDDWENLAIRQGISVSQAKQLGNAWDALGEKLMQANVTAGYKLTVTRYINGIEQDIPKEKDRTFYVYKVDGRWVTGHIFIEIPFVGLL